MRELTRAEIQVMGAGEPLDRLVAEKVMGFPRPIFIGNEGHNPDFPIYGWTDYSAGLCHLAHTPEEDCDHYWNLGGKKFFKAPAYSTKMNTAWEVVLKLCRRQPDEKWEGEKQHNFVGNDGGFGDDKDPKYHEAHLKQVKYWENTWEIQVYEGKVFAIFSRPDEGHRVRGFSNVDSIEEFPLAICRAALLTTMPHPEGE